MQLLQKHGLTDLTDQDSFYDLFYDEDIRFDYMLAFKKLTKCLNVVFPARQALEYMDDYQALTEINVLAGKHFRAKRLSMKGIPPKLRAITDKYLESKSIDIKVEPISILDEDFESDVGKRKRTKTKAAEIEHAIRHHLEVISDHHFSRMTTIRITVLETRRGNMVDARETVYLRAVQNTLFKHGFGCPIYMVYDMGVW